MSDRLSMIDLFAGCGGMTVGFHAEGYKPVLSVEWDRAAAATYAATYAANFGGSHTHWGDIREVEADRIPFANVVIGRPPRRDPSDHAGGDGNDPRNRSWREYLRFVVTARPEVCVIVGSRRISKSSEFQLLLEETDHGIIKDYQLSHDVLLAADYGVAQRRYHTVVIGSRIGRISLPAPTHSRTPTGDLRPWETVRSRIGGLEERPSITRLPRR